MQSQLRYSAQRKTDTKTMIATLTRSSPEDAGLYPEQLARIAARADEWAASETTQTLVLLVARHGRIAFFESFGAQNYDDPARPALDTVFNVSSVSKPVTATAVMILVERGELSLNRPLREYIPEMRGKYSERILLHQLLTHTSGFADIVVPPLFVAPPPARTPCPGGQYPHIHAQLEAVYGMDCYKKPGEQNMYCNENFLLLGEIVRRVTGQDIDAFAAKEIFAPLGMAHSTYRARTFSDVPYATPDPAGWMAPTPREVAMDSPNGAGTLKSNAIDLAIFGQTYLNGGTYNGRRLLNSGTVSEMTRNQIPGIGGVSPLGSWVAEGSWGLGWMVQGNARWPWSHGALQPLDTFYHQGASGCSLWVDRQNDLVGVYLSVVLRDMADPNPMWDFDHFQNMVTAAVDHEFDAPH